MEIRSFKEYRLRYKEKGAVRQHAKANLVTSSDFLGDYVCRKIKKADMPCKDMEAVRRHLTTLSNLEHPHICRFIEAFEDKDTMFLIYEKGHHLTLFEHVTAKSSLTEEEAADYMRQAAMALSVAHSQGIVHGRFSPRCVILADEEEEARDDELDHDEEEFEPDTQIKICDMGQAFILKPDLMSCDEDSRILEVQKYAVSPELACQDLVPSKDGTAPRGADKSDMWALGIVFYHMLSGRAPFKASNKGQLIQQLGQKSIKFEDKMWESLSDSAKDLIEQLMKLNPGLRISAAQTLRHPWVKVAKATFPKSRMVALLNNMRSNVEECGFKRFVLRVIAEQLPSDGKHVSTVECAYRCLDRNGDGILSVEEVILGLKKNLQQGADNRELEDLFEQIDRDGSGTLNVQEFVCASLPQKRSTSLPVLWDAFNAFDKDRSGHVTYDEIDKIVREIEGASMSESQVSAVCQQIRGELECVGSGGGIDFDQFVYIMKNSNPNFYDAVNKDVSRLLWDTCGVDNYKVRHLRANNRWDIQNGKNRGPRDVYRRRVQKAAIDVAG